MRAKWFYVLPTLAWLGCGLVVSWLTFDLLIINTPADYSGYIVAAVFAVIAVWSFYSAYNDWKAAQAALENNTSYFHPEPPLETQTGASAGALYPLSSEQLGVVKQTVGALKQAGIADIDTLSLVTHMERENICDDGRAGLYEVLLTWRDLLDENDFTEPNLAFTYEQVEHFREDTAALTSNVLRLLGRNISAEAIEVDMPDSLPGPGTVRFAAEGKDWSLLCTFQAKYTPSGLIEGLAAQFQMPDGRQLYWETIDSSLVLTCLTEDTARAFHAALPDDPFRFTPVLVAGAGQD